jgi:hypothetical protein
MAYLSTPQYVAPSNTAWRNTMDDSFHIPFALDDLEPSESLERYLTIPRLSDETPEED